MEREPIIGIDLGTTNSEVAIVEAGRPRVIEEDGQAMLPSVVGLTEEGAPLVGEAARNQWLLAPDRTIRSVKRRMGEDVKLTLGDQPFSPQEISAMILRRLKARAEQSLGCPVRRAVITVPAYFNDAQRQATREAGQLAGLDVVRIIHEPTAASLVYEADHTADRKLLVYDLGGGTFDVSIVRIEGGVVEVLASHGDTQLGGDDFDACLVDHVADRFRAEHDVDLRDDVRAHACLLRAVEQAKIRLSTQPYVNINEEFIVEKDGTPLNLAIELTRDDYESMIRPMIERTLEAVQRALTDAGLLADEIDRIVLAGGATRTPLVREELKKRTGQEPNLEVDPDLCVAMGAAIQASMIDGQDVGPVLVDVTPHTFGVRYLGERNGLPYSHCFSPIIHKNSALPSSKTEVYYTARDRQDAVDVEVYQGEDSDALRNTRVGRFRVEGLSEIDGGNPILCRLDLDLNGMLKVTATEKRTGLAKHIVIDNAMSRFESEEMAAAGNRLRLLFGEDDDAAPATVDEPVNQNRLSDPARDKADALVQRARQMLAELSDDDRVEVVNLIERIHDAGEDAKGGPPDDAVRELEDILFYLEEA